MKAVTISQVNTLIVAFRLKIIAAELLLQKLFGFGPSEAENAVTVEVTKEEDSFIFKAFRKFGDTKATKIYTSSNYRCSAGVIYISIGGEATAGNGTLGMEYGKVELRTTGNGDLFAKKSSFGIGCFGCIPLGG